MILQRLGRLAVACSGITFCLLLAAWMVAGRVDPRTQRISLSNECHLSLHVSKVDAHVVVFSDPYGPYLGSVVGLGVPSDPTITGFGECAGVYFRLIRWPTGKSLWTLSFSLLYPLAASAALPASWLFLRHKRRTGIRAHAFSAHQPDTIVGSDTASSLIRRFSCIGAVLGAVGFYSCLFLGITGPRDAHAYEAMNVGSHPVWKALTLRRIYAGQPVEEAIQLSPPLAVVRCGRWVHLEYGGLRIVARDNQVVAAHAWSCTFDHPFFDVVDEEGWEDYWGQRQRWEKDHPGDRSFGGL